MYKRGCIHIVGAGPGEVGLLTLNALHTIKNADVILYDALVNRDILNYAKNARHIFTGKLKGKHFVTQNRINRLMLKYYRAGKCVVRLKGGDPFIFGRGAEEVLFLKKHGITPHIIPGISSIQTTIYAGIPLTYREFTSMLTIITGHSGDYNTRVPVDYSKISKDATLCVLMGLKNINFVIKKLLENGFNENTPCAILKSVTMEDEVFIYGKLGNIEKKIKDIKPPAIFVIGRVVELYRKIKPRYKTHLVILFENDELYRILLENGYRVSIMPLLSCEPLDFDVDLKNYDCIIFTSREGVRSFYKKFKRLNCISILNGPGVMQEFLKYYRSCFVVPERYDFNGVIDVIEKLKVKKILAVRAYGLSGIEELSSMGYSIDVVNTYKQKFTKVKLIEADAYVFTSPNMVKKFHEYYGLVTKPSFILGSKAYRLAKRFGFKAIKSEDNTYQSLVKSINEYFGKKL